MAAGGWPTHEDRQGPADSSGDPVDNDGGPLDKGSVPVDHAGVPSDSAFGLLQEQSDSE